MIRGTAFIARSFVVALPIAVFPTIRDLWSLKCSPPSIVAGIEETDHLLSLGIDGSEIGPFVEVAVVTGEGKVFMPVAAAVLPWYDVLDVERKKGLGLL